MKDIKNEMTVKPNVNRSNFIFNVLFGSSFAESERIFVYNNMIVQQIQIEKSIQ